MSRTCRVAAVGALLVAAACGTAEPPTQPGTSAFASYAGVLGCAELVAWGTVSSSEPVSRGLVVLVEVEEWVYPEAGGESVRLLADDPARQVGAPTWPASDEPVLVVVSDVAPPAPLGRTEGRRAVQQWRDAGSPRLTDEQCARA